MTTQGRGFGGNCVTSALNRIFKTNAELPSYAVVVDAIDNNPQRLYERFNFRVLDYKRQCTRLHLPMTTVVRLILEASIWIANTNHICSNLCTDTN